MARCLTARGSSHSGRTPSGLGILILLPGQIPLAVRGAAPPGPPPVQPARRTSPFILALALVACLLVAALAALTVFYFDSLNEPVATPTSPIADLGTSNLYVEYILDASGSMNEALPDGAVKLAVAQKLLTQRLQAFRPETHIGLRAYGHRVHYEQTEQSCQDIELVAPVEVGQLPVIVTWLQDFQAQGMTPLAQSIREALKDFVFDPARVNTIVMLSDGIETCEGDPCGLVRELKVEGVNFTIHVIGLDVDEPTREQLKCIAEAGEGTYHDARSEEELDAALGAIEGALVEKEVVVPPGVDTPTPTPTATPAAPSPEALPPATLPAATLPASTPTLLTDTPLPPTLPPATNTPLPPSATPTNTPLTPTPTHTATSTPSPTPTDPMLPTPSGKLLAFTSKHEGNTDIYVVGVDGSNLHRITNTPAEEWHPAWSPDGSRLVFQCMAGGVSNVCTVNADGSGYTQITAWKQGEPNAQRPVWSPDGRQIAVSREPMGGVYSVWLMNADGSGQRQVMEGRDPSWSPDGSRIAFIRSDGRASQIWTASPSGANAQQLTEGDAEHMYPTWSPDGRQIAFEYDRALVAVMDAKGGQQRVVAKQPSWNLSWSPDGNRLAIASSGGGIYLVNVDGSGSTQITSVGTQPAWQPARR